MFPSGSYPWLLIILAALAACTANTPPSNLPVGGELPVAEPLRIRHAGNPAAIAVVVHGFNLKPAAMEEIENELLASRISVIALSLSGHNQSLDDASRLNVLRDTDFNLWRSEMEQAVLKARNTAGELPVILVGYSLGGLLSADYLNHHPDHGVSRQVLLAPALALRWSSYLLSPLGFFPNFDLPSLADKQYRANGRVPVSAYQALYHGVEVFQEQLHTDHLNIPTLVLIDPDDELVSPAGLRSFTEHQSLTRWEFVELNKSDDAGEVLNHLIIDRHTLGKFGWNSLSRQLRVFLDTKVTIDEVN